MGIAKELETYLKDQKELTDIVGQRIYPMRFPSEPKFPLITYHRISSPEHHDIPYNYPLFQFSCWAERYGETTELAEAIKDVLDTYKGYMGDIAVKRGKYENTEEMWDEGSRLYHFPVTIKIIYKRSEG